MRRLCAFATLAHVAAPLTARLNSGVSAQEILGLVRGLRKQQVPAWDRVKPRGFARRWASVTNSLIAAAIGTTSAQIFGLATMSFVSREKRKDRRANNSFKPTPFRCVACVRSLRSHTSPHRSRRGLTQALCGGHKRASLCWQSIAQPRPERRPRCDPGSPGLRPRIANSLGGAVHWPRPVAGLRWVIPPFLLSRA